MTTWTHRSENGIATSKDPIFGGIVDKAAVSGKWFFVPNSDHLEVTEGFDTKTEAMAALKAAAEATYDLA